MEDGNDSGIYQAMVELIAEVEASAPEAGTSFIDIGGIMAPQEPQEQKTYRQLIELIEQAETGKRAREQEKARQSQPQLQPQAPPHLVTSGVMQAGYASGMAQPQPRPAKRIQLPQVNVPGEMLKRQRENVAKEIGAIAGKLSSFKPKMELELRKRRIKISDLVLPSLSLADQISEVERIIEGLREHVFDKEHMEIVSQEVYGLAEVVSQQRKEAKGAPLAPLEQSLWDLRDQRLADAAALLEGKGAS